MDLNFKAGYSTKCLFDNSVLELQRGKLYCQSIDYLWFNLFPYIQLYPGSPISENLQYISAKTIQTTTCISQLTRAGYLSNVFAINVCTEPPSQYGICRGSEGSPLISNGALLGIVSYSKGCNGQLPDVHTRIQPYAQWVWQTTV